jgi:hypothetical protein
MSQDVKMVAALREFKNQLKDLSKNELVRQAADFYVRLTLAQFQIQALLEEKSKQNSTTVQKSE